MPSKPAEAQLPSHGRLWLPTWVLAASLALFLTWSLAGHLPMGAGAGFLFVPRTVGGPVRAQPIEAFRVPQHPFMAENGRSNMHNDPYSTKAYRVPGPLGRDPKVTSASYGLAECATLTFDTAGRLVGLCVDPISPTLKLIDPVSLVALKSLRLPGRERRLGVNPLADLCGGAYFYLDHRDRAVVGTTRRQVRVVEPSTMVTERTYELAQLVPPDDCLIALMPDWSGQIWFVTSHGRVGHIEPSTGQARVFELDGEIIANSIASDETGGIYVVSDHALYRFTVDGVDWRAVYDRGVRHKPGQLSWGSGTTPTLFGPGLIGITDNAEPRMNVVVYDRYTGARVCAEPVFGDGASATDNSLVAVGNSLIVENNYGYTGPQSTLFGAVSTPGIARVDVAGGRCSTGWTSTEIGPSCVPKMSLETGLLYVYTKEPHDAVAAWYLTAIDVRTGKTAFKVLTGTGLLWNNHYSAVTLGPDGSVYVATLGGLVRVRDA